MATGGGEEGEATSSSHPPHRPTTSDHAWAQEIEHAFGSPTTAWEWVKIVRRPRPSVTVERSESFRLRLAAREARRPLQVTVRYRGGPEAWWELSSRGRSWRFPGHVALHDVLLYINSSH